MRPSVTLLAVLLLMGCTRPARLDPVIVKDTVVRVPSVQPLSLNPVEWQVLPPAGKRPPLFALDETNYGNLSLNLIEIRRYLDEQKAVIGMLRAINDQRSAPAASIEPASPP